MIYNSQNTLDKMYMYVAVIGFINHCQSWSQEVRIFFTVDILRLMIFLIR